MAGMTDSAWWARIATPDGTHFYPLGASADPADIDARLDALRAEHSVPDDMLDADGWDVSITSGPLHPSIPGRPSVTVHDQLPG